MSGSCKRDRYALIALALALFAVVLSAWFSSPTCSLALLQGWNWNDSVAQYVIALSAPVAAFGSLFALIYLRRNLKTIQRSAELENRAWLDVRIDDQARMRLLPNGHYSLSVSATIANIGKGVAVRAKLTAKLVLIAPEDRDIRNIQVRLDSARSTVSQPSPAAIFPQANLLNVRFGASSDAARPPDFLEGEGNNQTLRGHQIIASFAVDYETASEPGVARKTEVVRKLVTGLGGSFFYEDDFDILSGDNSRDVHLANTERAEGRIM